MSPGDAGSDEAGDDGGTGLCTTAAAVVPTTNFFTDVSVASGIQDQNFVVNPATPISSTTTAAWPSPTSTATATTTS